MAFCTQCANVLIVVFVRHSSCPLQFLSLFSLHTHNVHTTHILQSYIICYFVHDSETHKKYFLQNS